MATSRDLAEKYQVQDKLADLFEFDPNCDVIRTKPPKALRLAAAAVTSAPSHVLDDDALRKTPARSRTTSEAHQSPPEMQIIYQQQELTPGDHFSVPSMPFPRANSSAHSSSPLNRILFDEVTTEAEFFASVYSRRNTRSPFLEKVTDEINSIKSPVTTSIPANSEDLKRDEILMAIYVDTDERLSVARLFENLKDPSDKTKFKVDMRLDDRSSTPLHWAAACGRLGLVQYLILNGCHPSIVAYGGETALMRAAYTLRNYSNRTFPHLLKLLETSLLVKDSHKRNIVHHIAIISKATPKRAASAYYMSCIADYIFQAENPRFFISFIDSQDEYSETPLHIACRYLNYRLADILIRLGADISKENKAGETPLNMVKSDDLRMNKIFQCKKLVQKY